MMQFLIDHQLNIMMLLSGICGALTILIIVSRALSKRRRLALSAMEITGMLLITFDRLAYIYSGDTSRTGFIMVRVSNFVVFFMTSMIVYAFNMYLTDLLTEEGKMEEPPKRLKVVSVMAILGMLLIVISQFTGIIYTFDEMNRYHRGSGFLLCYVMPILGPLIQLSVAIQYRRKFSRIIYISLLLYLIVPMVASIIQIFAYGISLTNMMIVLVSLSTYIFAFLDINETVRHTHEKELSSLRDEQDSIMRLFDETVSAMISAVEKKDGFGEGHSVRVARRAKMMAKAAGKDEDACNEIYYSALLHNVGLVGISDSEIEKIGKPGEEENEEIRRKPEVGSKILSQVTGHPYLKQAAMYSCEKYDGTGYPEGLSGTDIPEVARIVAVADAYDQLTNKKKYRDALPDAIVREEFIKEAGAKYDPEYARIMIEMMDAEANEKNNEAGSADELPDPEMECGKYRSNIAKAINVSEDVVKITFNSKAADNAPYGSGFPSIILYDSFDARVHDNARAIESYQYIEYGELWFDGHVISTGARNMIVENEIKRDAAYSEDDNVRTYYEITAGRYEDHLKLSLTGPAMSFDATVALQDSTKSSYIGLTGEYCKMKNITVKKTGDKVSEGDIERIAERISYIDRIESDIPNIQIDRNRSATTEGIPVKSNCNIRFHTMSLPTSSLVWHCPYILFYTSDDGKVNGANYKELELIKLNGENNGPNDYADSRFVMKKEDFQGWDHWKSSNREGMECEVAISKKGNRITMVTANLGISIHETLTIKDSDTQVYFALTGDQCALTDIRIMG
ncbi:MAG: HD domain-containing protein [Lachnospiraceae bacterium]|nr:HD domain-containing protein [Lachnospiraceae bacterium]